MGLDFRGYVQVYTGEGKGKTTAALGLALRALGAGLRVAFLQFLKKGEYSEICALRRFEPQVLVRQYHSGGFVRGEPSEEVRRAAVLGWEEARGLLLSGDFQVVILDEANVALSLGLIPLSEVLEALSRRPARVEVVFTGRGAPEALMEMADLVTEMRAVKHYYAQGVRARRGIEY
ncbi:cob(I)yrinic acid a,c-diamide adenosyltransferase [Thermosulfurimonas marina]|uniref:corrinoid adenosyltransferase n=1 Tax=Thermosulfurimonas marina TaxID=2047767 RepID=A0A6H1WT78_9BACT|nr:cob(I)yrinic acid a,c-diamide adenosyltransferase [Thermosulfurimonas marina]QJA06392.1 cob(I)yrinic acid a,c-diamide adenosyltransferase [Thermosulfurimonas marina]